MRVLLLHLSDIHIQSPDDPVLGRGDMIVNAVRNLDVDLDAAVVIVSGDVAFSGTVDQLVEGYALVRGITDGLERSLVASNGGAVPVFTAVVPGNHDCDFSASGSLRHKIVASLPTDMGAARDEPQVDVCLSVQRPFFEQFLPGIADDHRTAPGPYDERLSYEYRFPIGDSFVLVRCLNTAWLSRLHEEQGNLVFPPDAIQAAGDGCALALTVFHHPYNWLESNNARAFRRAVEASSDIVFTGHEHDGDSRFVRGRHGERNQYVEAGALQETGDPSASTFHAFVIDLDREKQRLTTFGLDGDLYRRVEEGPWEEFQVNRLRRRDEFALRKDFAAFLDAPGVELKHPSASDLRLSDVFVPPDLRSLVPQHGGLNGHVRGGDLYSTVHGGRRVLIAGDTQTGKTSLAKWLFQEFYADGLVPVYLDASTKPLRAGEDAVKVIKAAFADQYEGDLYEEYDQLPPDRRVLLIDNFHRARLAPSREKVLETLEKHAGHVVLLAHDLAIDLAELTGPSALAVYEQYRILPFGHVQRDVLIERWIGLDRKGETIETAAQRLDRFSTMLNSVFGRGYVPAHPVFILSVLQASDASASVNLKASTHGYFYELFIRAALARGGDSVEFDVVTGYLAHLAYQLFEENLLEFDAEDHRRIHESYEAQYDVRRSLDWMRDRLVERDILVERDGLFRFKHDYCYYYFVASYITGHLSSADATVLAKIRGHVRQLSRTLSDPESANILLFLAHLTRDPYVIGQMLEAAAEHFPDVAPITLDGDLDFLSPSGAGPIVAYEETDPKEFRRALLESIDEVAEQGGFGGPEGGEDAADLDAFVGEMGHIMSAISTLRILGQILKNFPGTLDRASKQDVAQACYDLGLRLVAWGFQPVRDHREAVIKEIADSLRADNPKADPEALWTQAERSVGHLLHLTVFGAVRMIASAVGSRELDVTYDRLLDESPTSAGHLIRTSLAIDHSEGFPVRQVDRVADVVKSSPVAMTVLRYMVVQHFHLFPRSFQVRQKVCDRLDIPFSKSRLADPRRKMIPTLAGKRD